MPGMSGLELVKAASALNFTQTSIYILTGGCSNAEAEEIMEAGGSGVLTKPMK